MKEQFRMLFAILHSLIRIERWKTWVYSNRPKWPINHNGWAAERKKFCDTFFWVNIEKLQRNWLDCDNIERINALFLTCEISMLKSWRINARLNGCRTCSEEFGESQANIGGVIKYVWAKRIITISYLASVKSTGDSRWILSVFNTQWN